MAEETLMRRHNSGTGQTSSPSLDSACRLSRVRAFPVTFWADFSARFAAFAAFFFDFDASAAVRRTACRSSSSDRCAYQMAMVPISAKVAIASR
jgi:hypothetical protein